MPGRGQQVADQLPPRSGAQHVLKDTDGLAASCVGREPAAGVDAGSWRESSFTTRRSPALGSGRDCPPRARGPACGGRETRLPRRWRAPALGDRDCPRGCVPAWGERSPEGRPESPAPLTGLGTQGRPGKSRRTEMTRCLFLEFLGVARSPTPE